jgi:ATP-binding cassette subfamily B multidrug efflux pump
LRVYPSSSVRCYSHAAPVVRAIVSRKVTKGSEPARARPVGTPGGGGALRRALGYLRRYGRDASGALIATLLVSAANLATPQLIRYAIDIGVGEGQRRAIWLAVVGLFGVALVRGVFSFLQTYLAERASQGVAYDLRDHLFAKIERLSFAYFDQAQTGQLLTRLTSDVEQIRTFTGTGIVQLSAAVLMFFGTLILLIELNWRLAIASLLTIPAIFLVLYRFVRQIGPLFGRVQAIVGRLNTTLQESLSGIRTVRAFAREPYETARYRAVSDQLLAANLSTVQTFGTNFPLVFLFANLGTLIVIGYGGFEVIGGRLSIGELVAFNAYLAFLLFPILTIGFQASGIPRASASAVRVFELLDEHEDVRDAPDAYPLPIVAGRVEFRDIHFRYPGSDTETLRGISFVAEPGQTVAILGSTGSGKSTLVNLIPRFYDATQGSILIDGHEVSNVTLSSLRSQIAIVLQETLLFSGTVWDNIAYGRPEATREEIEEAARAAQADSFIRDLPAGYATVIGERGVGLSGGQRQRIAIARALLVDRCLLVLDDSTSSVDAATEAAIREALDRLMRDQRRTAFVIAQRISTVRDADLILVLDDGEIAAQGNHDELVRESPLYNEILGSQLLSETAPQGIEVSSV